MDPRNAMSLAIVLSALVDTLYLEFDARLFCNTDGTARWLKARLASGRIPIEATTSLKENRLVACMPSEKSFQERTMKLMTTMPVAAHSLCTIGIIKDALVQSLEKYTRRSIFA